MQLALGAAAGEGEVLAAAGALFEACIAAIPYAPASAFVARERAKLAAMPTRPGWRGAAAGAAGKTGSLRVAILTDGIGATHGVTRTIEEIRQRGVAGLRDRGARHRPGGGPAPVRRRRRRGALLPRPSIGVPSLPSTVEALTSGAYDAVHVCSPGPAGIAGALLGRALGLPLLGSYHTELAAYAGLRSSRQQLASVVQGVVSAFYGACDVVLSPSPPPIRRSPRSASAPSRVLRWDRGVDTGALRPGAARAALGGADDRRALPGRITREKGVELLADAFLLAHAGEPRLRLLVAGGGPEQDYLGERLGERASFLGWLEGEALARAYADRDVFLFPSATDTFGQVILEAQASGLAVVAVAEGAPAR